MKDLYSFFNPESVAIIGASPKEGKIGNILVKNLINFGYKGKIFPINPKHGEILGLECFSKINEIQHEVDLVLVAVPAEKVQEVIDESTGRSHNFVVISAGFSEAGEKGKKMEDKLKKLAEDREINILGPNCLGFIHPEIKLNASFSSHLPDAGKITFLSQSGALAVAFLDQAQERKLGFSKIVSLGNKMQIGENALLNFLLDDEETKVIGLYLESFENGKEFLKLVSQVSHKKPVVILKAGRSQQAKKAMLSHTGSLSGEAKVSKALLEISGAIELETIEDFLGTLSLLSSDKLPQSNQAVIITNAGGPGVLMTDSFEDKRISLLEISDETKKELEKFLPEAVSLHNPVDILGDALEDRYEKTLEVFEKNEKVGIIFCLVTPQDQTPVEKIADVIENFSQKTQKLVIPIFLGGGKVEKARKKLRKLGLAVFDYPENAVGMLDRYFQWKDEIKGKIISSEINSERQASAFEIIERVKQEERKVLNAFEAEELMKLYNLPVSSVSGAKGSGFTFPLVLKVDGEKYLHKTDEGGVVLGIKNQKELDEKIEVMEEKFPDANLVVQSQEPQGKEIILGIKKDASFGPVVTYGLGGIFTEIFQKVNFLLPGMDRDAVEKAVRESHISFMFKEFRGEKPLNKEKFSQILLNLLDLANEVTEIEEMDINPLLAFEDDGGFKAVDVKVII